MGDQIEDITGNKITGKYYALVRSERNIIENNVISI